MRQVDFQENNNLRFIQPGAMAFREKVGRALRRHNFPYATNILVRAGGLGDFVQITPVARALKIVNPEKPVVAVISHPYGSLLDKHPFIDLAIEFRQDNSQPVVRSLAGLVENVFDLRYVSRCIGSWGNTPYFHRHIWYYRYFPWSTRKLADLSLHACDIMLHSLGLERFASCNDVLIIADRVPKKIPGEYVVVCGSPDYRLGGLKRWPVWEWNGLIAWLRRNGIIPVQLGKKTNPLLHPGVIDLRGKTTPRQAAGYLKLSRGYIGIEGGLFHLAKAVGTPAVAIFNVTPVVSFAYPDTRVVTRSLCRPCLWDKNWGRNYCLHGYEICINNPPWEEVAMVTAGMLG